MEKLKKKVYNLNPPEIRAGWCHGQEYAALAYKDIWSGSLSWTQCAHTTGGSEVLRICGGKRRQNRNP